MAGFIANLMRKNQQRANSNTVAAIKHIPYDSRALEFLSNGIEGGEEECIASAIVHSDVLRLHLNMEFGKLHITWAGCSTLE